MLGQPSGGLGLPKYHRSKKQQSWVASKRRTGKLIRSLWTAAGQKLRHDPAFLCLLVQCGWTNAGDNKGQESTRRWRNQKIADFLKVDYRSDEQLANALTSRLKSLTALTDPTTFDSADLREGVLTPDILRSHGQPPVPRCPGPLSRCRPTLPSESSRSKRKSRIWNRPHPKNAAKRKALRKPGGGASLPGSMGNKLGRYPYPRHHQTASGGDVRRRETDLAAPAARAFPLLQVRGPAPCT
jgi:hypothetical protein